MIEKITLYMGLNDKDSKRQEISTIDAYKIVTNLMAQSFDGCTISEADGVYKHDDGTVVIEKTIRMEILFASMEMIKPVVQQLKSLFNQESIAVQYEQIESVLM